MIAESRLPPYVSGSGIPSAGYGAEDLEPKGGGTVVVPLWCDLRVATGTPLAIPAKVAMCCGTPARAGSVRRAFFRALRTAH